MIKSQDRDHSVLRYALYERVVCALKTESKIRLAKVPYWNSCLAFLISRRCLFLELSYSHMSTTDTIFSTSIYDANEPILPIMEDIFPVQSITLVRRNTPIRGTRKPSCTSRCWYSVSRRHLKQFTIPS